MKKEKEKEAKPEELFPSKEQKGKTPYWQRPKILLRLDPNSQQPNWERVSPETVEELKRVMSTPEAAKALGLSGQSIPGVPAVPQAPVISEEFCKSLYDGLGRIEGMLSSFFLKIPLEESEAIFVYSDEEKSQLAPPTARVLSKYGPEWLLAHADEVQLVTALGVISAQKFQKCAERRKELEEQAKKEKQHERESSTIRFTSETPLKPPAKQDDNDLAPPSEAR